MELFYRINEQHLIENYKSAKADNFKGWDIHHRLELTLDGEFANSREDLKRMGMYYDRPYFELIYLKHAEHTRLHKKGKNNHFFGNGPMKGKHLTVETKSKLSTTMKGSSQPRWKNVGGFLNQHHSEEAKDKIRKRFQGLSWKLVNGKRVWYKKEAE